jgi:hypothetical protein
MARLRSHTLCIGFILGCIVTGLFSQIANWCS